MEKTMNAEQAVAAVMSETVTVEHNECDHCGPTVKGAYVARKSADSTSEVVLCGHHYGQHEATLVEQGFVWVRKTS